MKIGFCQFEPRFGEVDRNLETADQMIRQSDAELIVLPELFATGYQFIDRNETISFGETSDGRTIRWACTLAQEKKMILCGGFAENDNGKVYNSAFCVDPEGVVGIYRKIHLFSREKECFDPGNRGFSILESKGIKIGLMICFDWIFPESMRQLSLGGAQLICHPANLVLPYCQEAMKTRCLENGVFAITANRTGTEARVENETLAFSGKSQITGPLGEVLVRAEDDFSGVQSTDIDIESALDKSLNPFNDRFSDRRPQFYSHINRSGK